MTEQVPDSCTFDGRMWEIVSWDGPDDCVPENRALGFLTEMSSTANWAGRVDHFLIHKSQLYLFKVQVNLHPHFRDLRPECARREFWKRCEPRMGVASGFDEWVHEYAFFVYDDLKMDFTGSLHLAYPYIDLWNMIQPYSEEDLQQKERLVLDFQSGHLK